MKKFLCALLCLVITALSIAAPVMVAEEESHSWIKMDNELFTGEAVKVHPDEPTQRTINADATYLHMRLRWFVRRFNCGIYLSLWDNFDNNPYYERLEDVCEEVIKDARDDTLYIFYEKDSNKVFLNRTGIFADRLIGSDVQYIAELITSSEVESDYYRFTGVIDELGRILGDAPTTVYISLAGKMDYYNEEISEILEPIREKFDGHIQVECWYSDEADPQSDVDSYVSKWNELNKDADFITHFEDSIYIFYIGNTGETFINIGSRTGLEVKDLAAVQAAFEPAENDSDYSGFAAGIAALNKAIPSDSISTTTIIIIALAVVLVLAGIVYVIIKKKNSIPSKLG